MHIITKKKLEDFSKLYPDSKISLKFWFDIVRDNNFYKISDVLILFNSCDYVGNERFVFNISKNKYRLIAKFKFHKLAQRVYIRFVGTHTEYNKIKNISNI